MRRIDRIDGTCLSKLTKPEPLEPAPPEYPGVERYTGGSFHVAKEGGGSLHLIDNELTGSQCRYAISAYGANAWISPLDLRIIGGSYANGPNVATHALGGFYSGALHVHGASRKFVVSDETSITNSTALTIPKASVGYGATLVIDDDDANPFADGPYSSAVDVGGGGLTATIVECGTTSHPDCD
jgi:hypothetical protein